MACVCPRGASVRRRVRSRLGFGSSLSQQVDSGVVTRPTERVRIPVLARAGVLLLVTAASLAAAEVALRVLDGHRLDSLRLQPRQAPSGQYAGKFQDAED